MEHKTIIHVAHIGMETDPSPNESERSGDSWCRRIRRNRDMGNVVDDSLVRTRVRIIRFCDSRPEFKKYAVVLPILELRLTDIEILVPPANGK